MNAPGEQPPAVVVIDQSTIYNLLLEVRDDVRDVKKDLAELARDSGDHENRIRTLESRVWQASGAASVVGALAGFLLPRLFG